MSDDDRLVWKRRSFLGWTAAFGAALLTRPALLAPEPEWDMLRMLRLIEPEIPAAFKSWISDWAVYDGQFRRVAWGP